MNEQAKNELPAWFWIISAVALLWNLLGVIVYLMQVGMSAADLAALSEAERNLYAATPVWATAAFAIGVFGGLLGCLALLLRSALAIPLLLISLAGVAVQMCHALFLSDALAVYGAQAMIMPGLVTLVAILLVWFSFFSKEKRWLR